MVGARDVGRSRGARRAAGWVALAWVVLLGSAVALSAGAIAQSPDASTVPDGTPAGVGGPVDPRSSGEGPGLEAEPLIVLAGVVLLGLAAVAGTTLYVRLTRDD